MVAGITPSKGGSKGSFPPLRQSVGTVSDQLKNLEKKERFYTRNFSKNKAKGIHARVEVYAECICNILSKSKTPEQDIKDIVQHLSKKPHLAGEVRLKLLGMKKNFQRNSNKYKHIEKLCVSGVTVGSDSFKLEPHKIDQDIRNELDRQNLLSDKAYKDEYQVIDEMVYFQGKLVGGSIQSSSTLLPPDLEPTADIPPLIKRSYLQGISRTGNQCFFISALQSAVSTFQLLEGDIYVGLNALETDSYIPKEVLAAQKTFVQNLSRLKNGMVDKKSFNQKIKDSYTACRDSILDYIRLVAPELEECRFDDTIQNDPQEVFQYMLQAMGVATLKTADWVAGQKRATNPVGIFQVDKSNKTEDVGALVDKMLGMEQLNDVFGNKQEFQKSELPPGMQFRMKSTKLMTENVTNGPPVSYKYEVWRDLDGTEKCYKVFYCQNYNSNWVRDRKNNEKINASNITEPFISVDTSDENIGIGFIPTQYSDNSKEKFTVKIQPSGKTKFFKEEKTNVIKQTKAILQKGQTPPKMLFLNAKRTQPNGSRDNSALTMDKSISISMFDEQGNPAGKATYKPYFSCKHMGESGGSGHWVFDLYQGETNPVSFNDDKSNVNTSSGKNTFVGYRLVAFKPPN